jgi:thiol:disulfide interchange protein DsbD
MHQRARLTVETEPAARRAPPPRSASLTQRLCLLCALLGGGLPALAQDDFLPPDQAFRVSVQADGADAARVRWEIAEGYYLYASKFRFQSDTSGVAAGTPALPEPEIKQDEFFGETAIYRRQVEIRLPLTRDPGAANILALEITSQGCADAGFCYPPHRQKLLLDLPDTATTPAAPLQRASGSLGQSLKIGAEDEILPVEDAFRFLAEVSAPDRLQLTWDIAPGTYLYRHLIEVTLEDSSETAIGDVARPAGAIKKDSVLPDGSLGEIEVYHDRIDLTIPLLRRSTAPTAITLVAKYQGCAEIGICYPPQTQRVTLSLPEAAATTAPERLQTDSRHPSPPVSEQDRIAAVLAGGSLWAIVAVFFGFGLLLAFTPCVFPMIPILSGIIAGHASTLPGANAAAAPATTMTTRRAFTLSLVYVLAMALTYTLVGILAGLFGANLQAAFQNPWILSAFALVFMFLALSMFGFYDLQLPSSIQSRLAMISNRQQGGSLLGVAIMGLLSALIVGPCVAPPLFGALIYISQTGDAILGGIALFALSLGMGAPLIAIGTSAGKLLPRAGAWMEAIKAVFGVALLGVAILLLERILPAAVAMLLWGLLLICSAIYLGALTHLPPSGSGWHKLWKGCGVFLLVYGSLMLLGAAAGGKDTLQPLRGLTPPGGIGGIAPATFQRVKTSADLDRALTSAKVAGKPVMLDFYADWCVSCKEMERDTFSDPAAIAEMGRFMLLQSDVTANDAEDQALMQARFGIPGPPAMLFFEPTGEERKGDRLVGFTPAEAFAAHLRRVAP